MNSNSETGNSPKAAQHETSVRRKTAREHRKTSAPLPPTPRDRSSACASQVSIKHRISSGKFSLLPVISLFYKCSSLHLHVHVTKTNIKLYLGLSMRIEEIWNVFNLLSFLISNFPTHGRSRNYLRIFFSLSKQFSSRINFPDTPRLKFYTVLAEQQHLRFILCVYHGWVVYQIWGLWCVIWDVKFFLPFSWKKLCWSIYNCYQLPYLQQRRVYFC